MVELSVGDINLILTLRESIIIELVLVLVKPLFLFFGEEVNLFISYPIFLSVNLSGISLSSRPQMNILLTILGLISLGLGILGAFLPVLPTTPLLLLAAALFLRGNRNLYDWLMNHPKLGTYISNFVKHKAIPLRVKIVSISTLWINLLYCAVCVASHWALRLFFIVLAIGVTIHILSYKTLR